MTDTKVTIRAIVQIAALMSVGLGIVCLVISVYYLIQEGRLIGGNFDQFCVIEQVVNKWQIRTLFFILPPWVLAKGGLFRD